MWVISHAFGGDSRRLLSLLRKREAEQVAVDDEDHGVRGLIDPQVGVGKRDSGNFQHGFESERPRVVAAYGRCWRLVFYRRQNGPYLVGVRTRLQRSP